MKNALVFVARPLSGLFVTVALLGLVNHHAIAADGSPPGADDFVSQVLQPFWQGQQMRETMFFIQADGTAMPSAALLFKPTKILSVTSATRDTAFEAGRDYEFDDDTGTIRLPKGSRIPFKTQAELYPLMTSKSPKIGGKRGDPTRGIFFGEGALYHGLQVEVTYTHEPGQWKAYTPQFAGDVLPRTLKKLRGKEPVKILLSGDSISEGYNASNFTKAKPGSPPYGELVAQALEKQYGSKVSFQNFAHAGWQSQSGLQQAAKEHLGAKKPDLVMIAFGMNDVSYRNAAVYQKNIKGIMDTIRKDSPETEFILVAPMLGNPEFSLPMEQFPLYRDSLVKLGGPGVSVADMTSIWQEVLKRKSFYDLTGNGVNHPNDFGHRLYAQTIVALLVPPAKP